MLKFAETLRGDGILFGWYLLKTKLKTYKLPKKENGMTIRQDLKAVQKEFKVLGKNM
jgi:hypothetical protein